jgi:hypothetical protein
LILRDTCSECNHFLEMHYQPYCPRCEKDVPETIHRLNYVRCVRHIMCNFFDNEVQDESNIPYHDRRDQKLEDELMNMECTGDTDSTVQIDFPWMVKHHVETGYGLSDGSVELVNIMIEVFDLKGGEYWLYD